MLPIPFNNPRTYPGHSGVDYPQPHGTPFRASGNGTVTQLGSSARGGYFIWVQYDNGPHVGYHHMPSHAGCPRKGARVTEGSVLGHVGSTGNSTGPHLHSEVAGHETTAGYWKFFDSSRVVGTVAPSVTKSEKGDMEMIVNIRGKSGVRRGGAFYIADGVATFLGGNVSDAPSLSFEQGSELAKRVTGIR